MIRIIVKTWHIITKEIVYIFLLLLIVPSSEIRTELSISFFMGTPCLKKLNSVPIKTLYHANTNCILDKDYSFSNSLDNLL